MRTRDGRTNTLGMADNCFTLIAKIADERANTHLIVAIGALKLVDLGLDERFQLHRARKCAFDAFVHGCNFAAHGLAQRGDAITRDSFRLKQFERGIGHAARSVLHFLSTLDELCEAPEHRDRQRHTGNHTKSGGCGEEIFGGLQAGRLPD